jgi:predicted transposase YdaD
MADKPTRVIQVHDHAFRSAMSDLRVARDFLTHYLPTQVRKRINLKSLEFQKESFIDKELKLYVTDVYKFSRFITHTDVNVRFIFRIYSANSTIVPCRWLPKSA